MKVALCARPNFADAANAARSAAARIRALGHEVVEVGLDDVKAAELKGVEIAAVFGGDGTMLHAARALAPRGVPLLGVNIGHLGFLTIATTAEFEAAFADVAAQRYEIEERAMLDTHLLRGGREIVSGLALNDVVVARGALVRSIHVQVTVDDAPLIEYWADGVITATATGSTAYAFSVGGEPARLSIDGQVEHDLRTGDRVEVRRSNSVAKLVRTAHAKPFVSLLRQKILKEPGI